MKVQLQVEGARPFWQILMSDTRSLIRPPPISSPPSIIIIIGIIIIIVIIVIIIIIIIIIIIVIIIIIIPYHATTSLLPSATAASSLEINFSQNMSGISFNSSFEGSDKSDVMIDWSSI